MYMKHCSCIIFINMIDQPVLLVFFGKNIFLNSADILFCNKSILKLTPFFYNLMYLIPLWALNTQIYMYIYRQKESYDHNEEYKTEIYFLDLAL